MTGTSLPLANGPHLFWTLPCTWFKHVTPTVTDIWPSGQMWKHSLGRSHISSPRREPGAVQSSPRQFTSCWSSSPPCGEAGAWGKTMFVFSATVSQLNLWWVWCLPQICRFVLAGLDFPRLSDARLDLRSAIQLSGQEAEVVQAST